MYLKITLSASNNQEIRLPLQYNYLVQSLIYNLLEKDLADFLHEEGYTINKRQFKLFCFSQIFGSYRIQKESKEIIYENQIFFYISSPIDELMKQLYNALIIEESLFLGRQNLVVKEVNIVKKERVEGPIIVQALSPITIYSTMFKGDGKKYTCYFHPKDKEFNQLILENICKKHEAFYQRPVEKPQFKIIPLGKNNQHTLNYKGIIIKGYSGRYKIEGSKELINLALEAGIGGKNSQGFGYIQLI